MKRRKDGEAMRQTIALLLEGKPLEAKYRDHKLHGKYEDCRECHVQPDWLIIYRFVGNELHFLRTGTRADLFE
ncbi:MAG: type II toxin-antitoxin system YafQ family toxin [Bacteroidetes bacterium]|nr:type II toxin-antitoxin system YafQ family toxin [Bacteroidota bacterium]